MADILIRGMEMPKDCGKCFIGDRTMCADGCTLVKLPEHGDLIDRDAFIKSECLSCDGACEVVACDCLNCDSDCRCDFIIDITSSLTPVIVPASKEETE